MEILRANKIRPNQYGLRRLLKSFQSVVQEARSGKRLSISSIRVLVLLIN